MKRGGGGESYVFSHLVIFLIMLFLYVYKATRMREGRVEREERAEIEESQGNIKTPKGKRKDAPR